MTNISKYCAPVGIDNLETPCLLVNRSCMLRNIDRLRSRLSGTHVTLRPHLKTIKSLDAARLVLSGETGPATVSTLKEALIFGRAGITDLLYSTLISPQKLEQVTQLRREGINLQIVVDSVEAAKTVSAHSKQTNDSLPTLIEVDVDGHRSGVPVGRHQELIAIGEALSGGAQLLGVMTHAGESYELSDPDALIKAADGERRGALSMANALRGAGFRCPVVSVGSTPTGFFAESYEGVTEFRAGVYLFFDLVQAGIGVCTIDDIALTVMATVIGHQSEKGWIIIDAGWMALSRDTGTAFQRVNQFFGVVCDVSGRPLEDVVVLKANQEHGVVAVRPGSKEKLPDLPIGARIRILPNHACATSAQHDQYYVMDQCGEVSAVWKRFGGWSVSKTPKVEEAKSSKLKVLDANSVRLVADRKLAFTAVRDALSAVTKGDTEIFPAVNAIAYAPSSTLSIKSGINRGEHLLGLKVGTYWPENQAKYGLPNHGSTTLLLDHETGVARAVIDAGYLNGLRTAAANAVATDALARVDACVLAILGVGRQAGFEVRAICDIRKIRQIVVWGRSTIKAEAFAKSLSDIDGVGISIETRVEDAIANADIITTATSARAPLFCASATPKGVHISAMGADKAGKQELDPLLIKLASIFADNVQQSVSIGEFQHAVRERIVCPDEITTIGNVLTGAHPGRIKADEITIFDSSGIATQDLYIAEAVLKAAQ